MALATRPEPPASQPWGTLIPAPWLIFFNRLILWCQTGMFSFTPQLTAALPTTATVGMVACVSDATTDAWGDILVGGGALFALVVWDGMNWSVFAKVGT